MKNKIFTYFLSHLEKRQTRTEDKLQELTEGITEEMSAIYSRMEATEASIDTTISRIEDLQASLSNLREIAARIENHQRL